MPAISDELEKKAATSLFELVWGGLKGGAKRLWEETQIRTALSRYSARYRERHGRIKVLGMSEPMPLNRIYTEVRLLPGHSLQRFASAADLEAGFRESRRHGEDTAARDAFTVANEHALLAILGPPGSGKSTFLRRLGQWCLLEDGPYTHRRLPVLLALTEHRDCTTPEQFIAALAVEFTNCGFPESTAFVTRMLESGRLLVLLDGLDEVPAAALDGVIRGVRDLVDRSSAAGTDGQENRFVLTCRTAHYKSWFERFTDVAMADFSDAQIQKFAENWFHSDDDRREQTAQRLWQELQRQTAALELARTPLLLTFLCLVYEEGQALPRVRATLYKDALEILLRRWAASKRVHHDSIYADLHHDLELDMLARIAHDFFVKDQVFFTRDELLDGIRRFMAGELNAPKTLDAGGILDAIAIQQGLLVERASGVWSFSHLTLQEYLTARHLWNTQTWPAAVVENLFEFRWKEVFVSLAGMGKTDELLLCIAHHVAKYCLEDATLSKLLAWVETITPRLKPEAVDEPEALGLRLMLLNVGRGLDLTWEVLLDYLVRWACGLVPRIDQQFGVAVTRLSAKIDEQGFSIPLREWAELEMSLARFLYAELTPQTVVPELSNGRNEAYRRAMTDLRSRLGFPSDCFQTGLHLQGGMDLMLSLQLIFVIKDSAYSLGLPAWNHVCASLLRGPSAFWQFGSTHTSSALEGNTLTAEEVRTAILLPEANIPGKPREHVREVRNHDAALRQLEALLAERRDFTAADLFALHTTLMAGSIVDYLRPIGEWKRETNQTTINLDGQKVTNDTYAMPGHVPALMETWLAEFNQLVREPGDLVEAHIRLHAAFVRIHPFADGNGRLARMLANAPFIARSLPPLDIQPEDRDRYLAALACWQLACGPPAPGAQLLPAEHAGVLEEFHALCASRARNSIPNESE